MSIVNKFQRNFPKFVLVEEKKHDRSIYNIYIRKYLVTYDTEGIFYDRKDAEMQFNKLCEDYLRKRAFKNPGEKVLMKSEF